MIEHITPTFDPLDMREHFPARESVARTRVTFLATTLILAFTISAPARAQGLMEKMTKAAQGFASMTTEAGMIGAMTIDLEAKDLPTVNVGGLTIGVSSVEFKEAVGVRVHIYALNPTEEALSLPMPDKTTFVLVDGKGRRLQFLSLKVKDSPKGAANLVVPALERANLTVLYSLPAAAAPDATLKVGTAGMIRGIPLKSEDASAVPASTSSPAAPPSKSDTTVVPDSLVKINRVNK